VPFTCFWLGMSLVVIAAAGLGMRRALAVGDPHLALVLNALAILLVSPISWSHHWVWALPALLCLAVSARRLAVAGLALFAAGPQCWLPQGGDRELSWAPWQQIVGDSYVLFAVTVIGWFAYCALAANVSPAGRLAAQPSLDTAPLVHAGDVPAASSGSRAYPAYQTTSSHITATEPG
jgi:alpha-1,2-mannosyltransferase